MRRPYLLYLEDILASANKILIYTGDGSFEEIFRDEMRLDAIVRNFEIIGEATGHIPQEIRDKYQAVEWTKISDFRNVLAHEYFGIDYEIMWDVIKNKLPGLKAQVSSIIDQESPDLE